MDPVSLLATCVNTSLSTHCNHQTPSSLTRPPSISSWPSPNVCVCMGMKDHGNHVVGIILAVGGSGEELLRCVRPTVKMLQGLTADQRER